MTSTLSTTISISDLFHLAHHFAEEEGTAFLYSGGTLDSAQASYLFLFPYDKITATAAPGCWEKLQKALGSIPEAVGYLGYEMGAFADRDRKIPFSLSPIADACFYLPSCILRYDHVTGKASLSMKREKLPPAYRSLSWLKQPRRPLPKRPLQLSYSSDTLESYQAKIAAIKEQILEGEIYQVNLSQEFHLSGEATPFTYFSKVCAINPAPFSAFMNCGSYSLVSSSPERFLQKRGRRLETRPIKGTAPRAPNPAEDTHNRTQLLASEKERAELLMITDLMRSDLSRLSLPGSVDIEALFRCEAYTNVYHLLSIIHGQLKENFHPLEILRTLFPGGSITGCPKLSAMEAISRIEGRPRGIYTGSIGYFTEEGDFDFNIAIRTLLVHPERVRIQLGGAIVIDSDPVKEFEETMHKGRSLFEALGAFCIGSSEG